MIVKTPSLVLRRLPFRETSLIVTLLTRELGRIQVLAKGFRAKKPSEQGGLDLLTVGQSVIYYKKHKPPGSLHLMSDTVAFQQWYHLRRNLEKIYAGYYLAELALRLGPVEAPDPQLFRLFCRGLVEISRARHHRPVLDSLILRTLVLCGDLPALNRCSGCGCPAARIERPRFDYAAGGLLCLSCPSLSDPLSLSRGTVALLCNLVAAGSTPEQIGVTDAQARELGWVFKQVTRYILERKMRMEPFLSQSTWQLPALISAPLSP